MISVIASTLVLCASIGAVVAASPRLHHAFSACHLDNPRWQAVFSLSRLQRNGENRSYFLIFSHEINR